MGRENERKGWRQREKKKNEVGGRKGRMEGRRDKPSWILEEE